MVSRLRIARLAIGDLVQALPGDLSAAALYPELQKVVRHHLSPVTASLFAEPRATPDGSSIDWFSDLAGQPVALLQLPDPQRSEARAVLERRLQAIGALAESIGGSGETPEMLRAAVIHPGDEYVYVVDGQPVLTFWGHRMPVAVPQTAPASGLVGAAVGASGIAAADDSHGSARDVTADGIDRGTSSAAEPKGPRRWPWWLALALMLTVGVLFLLGILHWRWPPWGPDYAALLGAARSEEQALQGRLAELEERLSADLGVCELRRQIDAAEEEGRQLGSALDALADRLADELSLCPLRDELTDEVDNTQRLEQQLKDLEQRLARQLDACRKAARAKPTPPKVPPKQPDRANETLPPCPGERPPEDAPDVAVVLDASGSMEFPVTVDPSVIRDYRIKQAVGVFFGVPLPGRSGPTRLDAAKRGIKNVVGSLPEDVDIGLVVLADCPVANRVGFFSHSQRGRLNRMTDSLRPMRKTPLASGVEQAAQMVDGVDAPGVIVVISDGEDTCGGNPCAVARAMKARKPKLTINVVDILGDGASNCLAQATGGKVLTPRQGMSFEQSIRKAAEEAQKPAHCR